MKTTSPTQTLPTGGGLKTTFVNLKSELTREKESHETNGLEVYRTRLKCNCQKEFNRRDGILVVDGNNCIIEKVIRCKACVKNQSFEPSINI
jgi:hypothetical protein